ncbi:MAG TPA: hypothetical protein DDY98_07830 [Ruminococcaceae bacterium]|nr:hypothetical protein [Oscillospiraceae bacterium]
MDEKRIPSAPMAMSEIEPYLHEAIRKGESIRVRVKGSSMSPFFKDGKDSVYFSALPKRAFRSGDILLYKRTNGVYVMHRLYRNQNGMLTFVGDNQNVLEHSVRTEQVLAYVRYAVRNGKELDCEHSILNRFMILYMKMRIRLPKLTQSFLRIAVAIKHIGVKKT